MRITISLLLVDNAKRMHLCDQIVHIKKSICLALLAVVTFIGTFGGEIHAQVPNPTPSPSATPISTIKPAQLLHVDGNNVAIVNDVSFGPEVAGITFYTKQSVATLLGQLDVLPISSPTPLSVVCLLRVIPTSAPATPTPVATTATQAKSALEATGQHSLSDMASFAAVPYIIGGQEFSFGSAGGSASVSAAIQLHTGYYHASFACYTPGMSNDFSLPVNSSLDVDDVQGASSNAPFLSN